MRRFLAAASAVVLLYLVILVSRLPASWVIGQFAEQVPFQLDEVSGSIWSGRARFSYAGMQLDAVNWQLAFWPLLLGKQHVTVQVDDPALRLQAQLQHEDEKSQLVINDLWFDTTRLNTLHVLPAGLEIAGVLQADVLQLALEGERINDAAGTVNWSPAYLLAPQSYRHDGFIATLKPENGQLSVLANDLGGEFSMEAIGWLDVSGNWRYRISLQARDNATDTVREAIRRLGPLDSDGRLNLQASGRL